MKKMILKYMYKNKIFVFIQVILFIFLSSTIILGTYEKTIYKECFENSNNSEPYRTIYLNATIDGNLEKTINNVTEEVLKINNVLDVFLTNSFIDGGYIENFKNKDFTGLTELHSSSNKTIPNIIKGSNFPDNDNYYMICPSVFFPGTDELNKKSRLSSLKIDDKIGQNFDFEYDNENNKTISIKLIGMYEPSSTNTDEERACYTNKKTLYDVYLDRIKSLELKCKNECREDCEKLCSYNDENPSFTIIINDKANKDNVISELEKIGYEINDESELISNSVNQFYEDRMLYCSKIVKIFSIFYIIIMLFVCILYFLNLDKLSEILELLGMKKNEITLNIIFLTFVMSLITIIVSFIMSIGIKYLIIFINYLYPLIFEKYGIIFDYSYYYIFILITILLTFISGFITNIIKNWRS